MSQKGNEKTPGGTMADLGQTVRRVVTDPGRTIPLKGQMTVILAWITVMAFVMVFTLKNMYYLQKEGQIRELLLTPQDQ